jgi:hypothetical protein
LGFPPAIAEGFDELVTCNCGFHDLLNRAVITRHSLPVAR